MKSISLASPERKAPFAHPMMLALRPWLDGIAHGTLRLRLPSGEMLEARGGPGPDASLALNDWRAVRRLLLQGEIGFAEGFVAGDWTTPISWSCCGWAR